MEVTMKREDVLERTERALAELATQLEQGKSDCLLQYLDMLSRFHRYSMGNCMLIAMQRPTATQVAGYQRWKQLKRQVKKGESGIAILAPLVKRRKVDKERDDGTTETVQAKKLYGFRVVHVFDVEQTEGEPLAEFAKITGEPGDKLHRLEAVIRDRRIELEYVDTLGGALGVSSGKRIEVLETLEDAEKFSVLAHELGHELLHQGTRRKDTTKTIRETEAEAVAFVVCRASGIECSSRSSDYIQLYNGDNDVLMESLEHIQRAASNILCDLERMPAKDAKQALCA